MPAHLHLDPAAVPLTIKIVIGERRKYVEGLKRRLEEYDILPSEVAAACEPPMHPSQLSRWFHTDTEPSDKLIARVEQAIVRIRATRRGRRRFSAVRRDPKPAASSGDDTQ